MDNNTIMNINYSMILKCGLLCSLTLMNLAIAAEQSSGNPKTNNLAKYPTPEIDGFWQTGENSRTVYIFGNHLRPRGATQPLVTIGGKPSLWAQAVSDNLMFVLPPLPQTKGSITLEMRTGSPPKTIARAISHAKLGAVNSGVTINGIWPDHGPVGTFVFVFGSGFAPNKTRVTVNKAPAPLTQIIDQSLLIAQVPSGAASGAITVNAGGKTVKSKTVFGIQ